MQNKVYNTIILIALIIITSSLTVIYKDEQSIRISNEFTAISTPSSKLRMITEGGVYDAINIHGTNKLNEDGLTIKADAAVTIKKLYVDNVRVPVIFTSNTPVTIEYLYAKNYTGDGLNIRQSNVTIKHLLLVDPKPSEANYHQDQVLQAYAVKQDGYSVDKEGVIENINIPNITLVNGLPDKDIITLSEDNIYRNFQLGTESLLLEFDHTNWVNASNLSNSTIGNENFFILRPKDLTSSIFIRDRKGFKDTERSFNNHLFGNVIR